MPQVSKSKAIKELRSYIMKKHIVPNFKGKSRKPASEEGFRAESLETLRGEPEKPLPEVEVEIKTESDPMRKRLRGAEKPEVDSEEEMNPPPVKTWDREPQSKEEMIIYPKSTSDEIDEDFYVPPLKNKYGMVFEGSSEQGIPFGERTLSPIERLDPRTKINRSGLPKSSTKLPYRSDKEEEIIRRLESQEDSQLTGANREELTPEELEKLLNMKDYE